MDMVVSILFLLLDNLCSDVCSFSEPRSQMESFCADNESLGEFFLWDIIRVSVLEDLVSMLNGSLSKQQLNLA